MLWKLISSLWQLTKLEESSLTDVYKRQGLSRVTVGTTFIACLLTIVGYSINATIVIFDRIRENKAVMKREDTMIDTINQSITQTLTRSIYTCLLYTSRCV